MIVNFGIWAVVSLPLVILLWLHRLYTTVLGLFLPDRTLTALWEDLRKAETFEAWEAAGLALDRRYKIDQTWRKTDRSSDYAWELIGDRLAAFALALQTRHVQALVHLLQSGLVRNLGNIAAPALYNVSFVGTKYLIENYILQVCEIIQDLVVLGEEEGENASLPTMATRTTRTTTSTITTTTATLASATGTASGSPISPHLAHAVAEGWCQMPLRRAHKRQLFDNLRQSFGRTSLVLQGGSVFGLCHLGVARALFLQRLLPRIITGTGTGALIAALLCTHTDAELPKVLDGELINLSAFASKVAGTANKSLPASRWTTLQRRVMRFCNEGYFLDIAVLAQCVRVNGGDMTFDEAFRRTGRTLNITVVTGDVPIVLNYVTAPNVLIWTAAVASNVARTARADLRSMPILCKDHDGRVIPWPFSDLGGKMQLAVTAATIANTPPLQRVAQFFNVNHFVVSQARPYLVPFLEPSMHSPAMQGFALGTLARARRFVLRRCGHLVRHRLEQLVHLGWLPGALRRLLLDEQIPGAGWDPVYGRGGGAGVDWLVVVPSVGVGDFPRLLDVPTPEGLHDWIRKGEQAVWPAVAALKIRCSVELALERACQDLAVKTTATAMVPQGDVGGLRTRDAMLSRGG